MAPARFSAASAARVRWAATLAAEAACCTATALYWSLALSRSLSSTLPASQGERWNLRALSLPGTSCHSKSQLFGDALTCRTECAHLAEAVEGRMVL